MTEIQELKELILSLKSQVDSEFKFLNSELKRIEDKFQGLEKTVDVEIKGLKETINVEIKGLKEIVNVKLDNGEKRLVGVEWIARGSLVAMVGIILKVLLFN